MVRTMVIKKWAQGFNLYEMLAVLSIVAIMLSLAIPLITHQLLARNNEETALQFQSVFKNAQEEALRRNAGVAVCAANYSSNNYLTSNGCIGTNDWSEGILSYIDLNRDNGYDSGERIQSLQFTQGVTVSGSVAVLYVDSNGEISDASGNDNWTFNLSQSRFGISVTTKVKLNSIGYFSTCTVGDAGC